MRKIFNAPTLGSPLCLSTLSHGRGSTVPDLLLRLLLYLYLGVATLKGSHPSGLLLAQNRVKVAVPGRWSLVLSGSQVLWPVGLQANRMILFPPQTNPRGWHQGVCLLGHSEDPGGPLRGEDTPGAWPLHRDPGADRKTGEGSRGWGPRWGRVSQPLITLIEGW